MCKRPVTPPQRFGGAWSKGGRAAPSLLTIVKERTCTLSKQASKTKGDRERQRGRYLEFLSMSKNLCGTWSDSEMK